MAAQQIVYPLMCGAHRRVVRVVTLVDEGLAHVGIIEIHVVHDRYDGRFARVVAAAM